MSRPAALFATALVVAAAVLLAVLYEGPKQAAPGAPNVIVIMTDDQALNTWNRQVMPRTFERFEGGTNFTRSFAVPPLCCPARASLMTGRYPHNHGVTTNNYKTLEDPEDVLPVWLSDAGYETMMAGKFLNGYARAEESDGGVAPAPGWTRWWVAGDEKRKYFDYEVSIDGEVTSYGTDREDYFTSAVTEAALDFMTEEAGGESPYFLWLAHAAPHESSGQENPICNDKGPVALPGDFRSADAKLPTDPSYFERNVTDKPGFIARRAGRSRELVKQTRLSYRCTVASLAAVDRSVDAIFETLQETGEADNTAVFFTSDNGTYFGEYRKPTGKKLPYDPSARVPLAVSLPGERRAPESSPALSGTHDIAPTILELAGLEGEHRTDGRSLAGLLRDEPAPWPRDRAVVLEIGNAERCIGYRALRTPTYLYTEYLSPPDEGEECELRVRELYDVRTDPFMLRNLLGVPGATADEAQAEELAARLAEVNSCSGIEGRDPAEEDAPFCE